MNVSGACYGSSRKHVQSTIYAVRGMEPTRHRLVTVQEETQVGLASSPAFVRHNARGVCVPGLQGCRKQVRTGEITSTGVQERQRKEAASKRRDNPDNIRNSSERQTCSDWRAANILSVSSGSGSPPSEKASCSLE